MAKTIPPWKTKRKMFVRADDVTDPRFGHEPQERPIEEYIKHGFINLDKPAGPTSHETAAWVKRILNLEHVGHGGTLEA